MTEPHKREKYEIAIGRYFIDDFPTQKFPELACDALEDGYDGPAIVEMAGLKEPNYFGIRDLLSNFLSELDLRPLTKSEAALIVAKEPCKKIVSGVIDPKIGAQIIYDIWVKAGLPRELQSFVQAVDYIDAIPQVAQKMKERIISDAKELLKDKKLKKLNIQEFSW